MKTVHVQLRDQNGENAGTITIPLVRTTHVRRAIEERLEGERIIEIKKEFETGGGATWVARIEI